MLDKHAELSGSTVGRLKVGWSEEHVISSSPGDLEPVFNAMIENATRLKLSKAPLPPADPSILDPIEVTNDAA